MTITKLGHCCLLIKVDNLTILTDPGVFSTAQDAVQGVDVVLVTHEHADHLHVESLQRVLQNNPGAQVITNSGVGRILAEKGVAHTLLEGRSKLVVREVKIEAHDGKHGEIYGELGQVQNTGYMIAGRFFYPGDSFHHPGQPVEILALPVAGPWCRMADAINYALAVKPKVAFPVHDGMIIPERLGPFHNMPSKVLPEHGIKFVALKEGDMAEF